WARPGSTGSRPGPTGSRAGHRTSVPRHDASGRTGVSLAVEVRPAVGHAALHVEGLLLHHRCRLAIAGTQLVPVPESVTDLMVDGVLPVHLQRGAVVGDALQIPG